MATVTPYSLADETLAASLDLATAIAAAQNSAEAAAGHAARAEQGAQEAEAVVEGVTASASAAAASAGAASDANSAAQDAKGDAEAARDLARDWATKTSGEVETGLGYSAKKHAQDAADDANAAHADRVQTGLDRIATGQDRQAVADDKAAVQASLTALTGVTTAWTNVKAAPYNAVGNGSDDDWAKIQNALNDVGAAGGGDVFVPAGTYRLSKGLSVPSNTRLRGAGMGATVFTHPAGALPSVTIAGVNTNATIAMIGVSYAAVSDICVNHQVNSPVANGIQIGEYGASSRSFGCRVERCLALGVDDHKYLFYNKLADFTKIVGCYAVGTTGATPTQDIAGVEVFGGEDVEVQGCLILRCSTAVLFKSQSDVPGSYVRRCKASGNTVLNSIYGPMVSVGRAGADGEIVGVEIAFNTVTNMLGSSARNLYMECVSGGLLKDVVMAGNVLSETGRTLIDVNLNTGALASNIQIVNNVGRAAANCDNYASFYNATDVLFANNTFFGGGAYYGFTFRASTNVRVEGNSCGGSRRRAVQIQDGCSALRFKGNDFDKYDSTEAGDVGAYADATVPSSDITFERNDWRPYAATVGHAVTNVAIALDNATACCCVENRPRYTPTVGFVRNNGSGSTSIRMRPGYTPSSSSAAGSGDKGDVAFDDNYQYRFHADNASKRIAWANY